MKDKLIFVLVTITLVASGSALAKHKRPITPPPMPDIIRVPRPEDPPPRFETEYRANEQREDARMREIPPPPPMRTRMYCPGDEVGKGFFKPC